MGNLYKTLIPLAIASLVITACTQSLSSPPAQDYMPIFMSTPTLEQMIDTPTYTPSATPDIFADKAIVKLLKYDDINRNNMPDKGEYPIGYGLDLIYYQGGIKKECSFALPSPRYQIGEIDCFDPLTSETKLKIPYEFQGDNLLFLHFTEGMYRFIDTLHPGWIRLSPFTESIIVDVTKHDVNNKLLVHPPVEFRNGQGYMPTATPTPTPTPTATPTFPYVSIKTPTSPYIPTHKPTNPPSTNPPSTNPPPTNPPSPEIIIFPPPTNDPPTDPPPQPTNISIP